VARSAGTAALHGRLAELQALEAWLDRAVAGTFECVLVEGEAGIGKTRVLEAVLASGRARGFQAFLGAADEIGRGRPFGPLAEALGCVPEADEPRRAEVTRLLSGGTDVHEPALQFRVLDALVDLVEELALAAPVALALDDLQWADPSTLLALRSLGRRLTYLPVALVATLRPLPRSPELERLVDLLGREGAHHLALGPLEEDAVATLVGELVGAEPSAALVEEMTGAAGNPFFVTELVGALVEEAAIVVIDGRAELRRAVIPPSLRLTILRRLGFLDAGTLELLRIASALGSTFSLRDVAIVMDRPAAALVGAVSDALRAGVVVERGERLGFRHHLIREAIYADLPKDVRAGLHFDAGRRLAAAGAPAVRVAEQLSLGAEDEDAEAAAWLRRAAPETAPRDPAGAIGLLRQALELLPPDARDENNEVRAELATLLAYAGSPVEAEAVAREVLSTSHDSSLEARLRSTLIQALFAEGRWAEVVAETEAARRHPHVLDHQRGRLLAEAALARIWLGELDGAETDAKEAIRLGKLTDDPAAVCFGLGHLSAVADQRGRFHEGLQLAREGVDVAMRANAADAIRRHPHIALGAALAAADRLREAREALDEGRRLGERAGTAWDLPLYHSMLALPLYYLGEWDDALAEIEAGLTLADELGSGVGRVTALSVLSDIAAHRDDMRGAREAIEAATAIVDRHGPQWGMLWLTLARAHVLDATGDADEAFATLRDAWQGMSAQWVESALRIGPALARAAKRAGDDELVRAVAAAMDAMAGPAGVPYANGGALLCRALADSDGNIALEAVEAYRPSERLPELAAACEDAGRLLAAEGSGAPAHDLFEEALAGYEQLGAARDIARTLSSMRDLGLGRKRRGARKRPATGWESLTPSEREVVRLAAEGLTNPEIGQRLFISRRTVQTHLAHAFRKLDISSRVELAAEAARRGAI
jgi:DNA-binding CsgD family transcriptional regulator/tetratricopeptide (TPR) repeat protein